MTVILVTRYTNVFSIKQVPRLLKFSVVSGVHWMKLIDVINNPHFNRFEFDRNPPGFKDRSCLRQVKLIFIFSNKIAISNNDILWFGVMSVEVIKYYNEYVLDVHMLADPPKYYKRLRA